MARLGLATAACWPLLLGLTSRKNQQAAAANPSLAIAFLLAKEIKIIHVLKCICLLLSIRIITTK